MQEAIVKMDDGVINVAEQTVVGAQDASDEDHSKASVVVALKSALHGLLVFILDDSSGIRDIFGDARNQVKMAPKSLALISFAAVRETLAIGPTARYDTKLVKQKAEKSV